jgi:hypothetical protein
LRRAGRHPNAATWRELLALCALSSVCGLAAGPAARALETRTQLGPVSAWVHIEPDAPVIGDPMQLTVEAVAEDGVEVLMPEFGEALDRFSIVDFVPRQELDSEGRTVFTQRYTLKAPVSGEHTLPPLLIEFVDHRPGNAPAPEGEDAYELLTDPLIFTVESLVPDAATADLSPPMESLNPLGSGGGNVWPWVLCACLAAAGASPFAYRAFVRWRDRARVVSAYELARGALDELRAGPRPSPERVDAFYVKLSGVVRRYLEDRFTLRSPELTTEGFLELASGSPDLRSSHKSQLRDFLRQSDLVKFANHIPSPEDIEKALATAESFVEETRADAIATRATAGAESERLES